MNMSDENREILKDDEDFKKIDSCLSHALLFQHEITESIKQNIEKDLKTTLKDRFKSIKFGYSPINGSPNLQIETIERPYYINFHLRPYLM